MMSAIKGRAVGNLVIGVSKHLGGLIVPDAVNRLMSAFPGVWVEVIEGYTEELAGLLLNGSADILFVGYKEQAHAPALVYEKLLDSDSVIVAHPSHPLTKKALVTRAELMKARWILTVEKSSIFQFYNSLDLEGSEYDPSNLPILSSSSQFTARMIRSGGFIAVSARHTVADDLAAGKLAEVRGTIRKRSPNIGIVLRRKGYRSPMLVRLIKEIRSVAKGR
jgi:DNA-binding transcriptional LysR family regulator